MLRHLIPPSRGFTQIPNEIIFNNSLSPAAFQIWARAVALSPRRAADTTITDIAAGLNCGRRVADRGRKDLYDLGLAHSTTWRDDHGLLRSQSLVSNTPITGDQAHARFDEKFTCHFPRQSTRTSDPATAATTTAATTTAVSSPATAHEPPRHRAPAPCPARPRRAYGRSSSGRAGTGTPVRPDAGYPTPGQPTARSTEPPSSGTDQPLHTRNSNNTPPHLPTPTTPAHHNTGYDGEPKTAVSEPEAADEPEPDTADALHGAYEPRDDPRGPDGAPSPPEAPSAPLDAPDGPPAAPGRLGDEEVPLHPAALRYAGDAEHVLMTLRDKNPSLHLGGDAVRKLLPYAAEWLMRGVTPEALTLALTNGTPPRPRSPRGLVLHRLTTQMPQPPSFADQIRQAAREDAHNNPPTPTPPVTPLRSCDDCDKCYRPHNNEPLCPRCTRQHQRAAEQFAALAHQPENAHWSSAQDTSRSDSPTRPQDTTATP